MGAVRFEYGGGSGVGVESRGHNCVLPWAIQAGGRLRVSVWGGQRGGSTGGRNLDGCLIGNSSQSCIDYSMLDVI